MDAVTGPLEQRDRIVGGMFGLEAPASTAGPEPEFLRQPHELFVNARSAFASLLERVAPPAVWLPSYLCSAVVDSVRKSSVPARFYPVNRQLRVAPEDWIGRVQPGEVVLFIDYFGIPSDPDLFAIARSRGAIVVEDACQSLLSTATPGADFRLFSPRKFLGVPDGGVLFIGKNFGGGRTHLAPPPAEWWQKSLSAASCRAKFDREGGDRDWFDAFQSVEENAPIGAYSMSDVSRDLLFSGIDYVSIGQRRRENLEVLAAHLGSLSVFPRLEEKSVPLGFPIRVRNRDEVLDRCFAAGIYPPIHWPIAGIVPEEFRESHLLSSEILTLPCDQRYNAEDMLYVADVVARVADSLR